MLLCPACVCVQHADVNTTMKLCFYKLEDWQSNMPVQDTTDHPKVISDICALGSVKYVCATPMMMGLPSNAMLALHANTYMVHSIGNGILGLIFTLLDNRRILQLDLKVMPCVVERLHDHAQACLR